MCIMYSRDMHKGLAPPLWISCYTSALAMQTPSSIGPLVSFDGVSRCNPGPSASGLCAGWGEFVNGAVKSSGLREVLTLGTLWTSLCSDTQRAPSEAYIIRSTVLEVLGACAQSTTLGVQRLEYSLRSAVSTWSTRRTMLTLRQLLLIICVGSPRVPPTSTNM